MSNVQERIKEARKAKGFSQEELAEKLNMTQTTFSNLESGKTALTMDRMQNISDVLEIPITELLPKNKFVNITGNYFSDNAQLVAWVENYYESKEKLFAEQINQLKEEIAFLREMLTKGK